MAREIAVKEDYFPHSDEAALAAIIEALTKRFLLIDLGGYRIEVDELDYAEVTRLLDGYRRGNGQPA